MMSAAAPLLLCCLLGGAPAAQGEPRDAGAITLDVDARDIPHRVFSVHESIPITSPGPLVLHYPQWDPASHAPTGSAASLAGLVMTADGRPVEWRRDPLDPFTFRLTAPAGARRLDLDFQVLTAFSVRQGAVRMTPAIIDLQWPDLLLYPAGGPIAKTTVKPSLRLPPGFDAGSALRVELAGPPGIVRFQTTSLEKLADSPVLAGLHFESVVAGSFRRAPVRLYIAADDPAGLAVSPTKLAGLKAMLVQAERLLPGRPFGRYDFLVALSERLPGPGGVEHRSSSDDVLPPGYFGDGPGELEDRDLLAHEFVHAWNGLARRPAGLVSPDLNTPVSNDLLWVYEGQTEFWGRVLAARAGLRTFDETLDALAGDAAVAADRPGRAWKSLQDSTNDPLMMAGRPVLWRDWQRREDYYGEGVLLWLDVDMRLRELTGGRRSLDDFARAFFRPAGEGVTSPYDFADVVAALNTVAPADWAAVLRQWLDRHDDEGLLEGLRRAGYRLAYTSSPGPAFREAQGDGLDLTYSLGVSIDKSGLVRAVAWNGPAFRGGLAPGARLLSVDGQAFSPAGLLAALNRGRPSLTLTVEADGETRSAVIPHPGPPRYPRLERIPGAPDRLQALLAPLSIGLSG